MYYLGVSAVTKETPPAPWPLLPCEHTIRYLGPRRRSWLAPWSGNSSLQNCEQYISIYKPPSLWYFVIAAGIDKDTSSSSLLWIKNCSIDNEVMSSLQPHRQGQCLRRRQSNKIERTLVPWVLHVEHPHIPCIWQ